MACKPKPQLRMADGGELMRRFANRQPVHMLEGTPENMSQNTAPMTAQDQGAFNNLRNTGVAPVEAAAGLRDGGTVPGKGKGDKIPALYEPGEFVVSNDMLDAAPGLREELHDLRGNVLAAKGKTVAEANAQAYSGGPQRNQHERQTSGLRETAASDASGVQAVGGPRGNLAVADGRGRSELSRAPAQVTLRAQYGFDDFGEPLGQSAPGPATARVPAAEIPKPYTPPRVNPATGQYGAAPAAPVAEAAPSQSLWGRLRGGAGSVGNGAKAVANGSILDADVGAAASRVAGGALQGAKSLAGGLGRLAAPLTLGASALQTANTDTDEYARRMGTTAGDSFGKDLGLRAVGALADLGDTVTMGHATKLGNWIAGNGYKGNDEFAAPDTAAASPTQPQPTSPSQTSQTAARTGLPLSARTQLRAAQDPRLLNADTSRPELGAGRDFSNELNGARSTLPQDLRDGVVHKTIDAQGRVTYSGRNVAPGADGSTQFVDGMGRTLRSQGNVSSVPGMDPGLVASTLRNPDGSKWSAADNAIMAANLRDGVNPYRGTSRAAAEDAEAIPAVGEFGHNRAVAAKLAQQQNATVRRGQDIQSADNRYGHELSTEVSRNRLRYDMNKDQRDFQTGRDDANFTQGQAAQKAVTEEIASYIPPGPDGKPDMATASQYMGALNAHVAERMSLLQKQLQLNPNDTNAASELAGLQKRGVAQLGPDAKRKFIEGQLAANVAGSTATGSMTPWGTAAVDSTAPITSLRRKEGWIGHDYVSNRGDVIPGRYIDRSGSVLGFGGRPNRNFDSLKLRD